MIYFRLFDQNEGRWLETR